MSPDGPTDFATTVYNSIKQSFGNFEEGKSHGARDFGPMLTDAAENMLEYVRTTGQPSPNEARARYITAVHDFTMHDPSFFIVPPGEELLAAMQKIFRGITMSVLA
jgi:hypothetical protein